MSVQFNYPSSFAESESPDSMESAARQTRLRLPLNTIGAGAGMLLRRLLQKIIRKGSLAITAPDGCSYFVGDGEPAVAIRIADPSVVWRLLLNPDLAVGEAYMEGALTVESGDVYDFLNLCFVNLGWSSGRGLRQVRACLGRFSRHIGQRNPVGVARRNVAHHYDLSDNLYELFLDSDRQYSCAYFVSPDDTLERAQEQKKRHLAAKLLLRPGQRILDIGSGWGGLGIYLAHSGDVDVTA